VLQWLRAHLQFTWPSSLCHDAARGGQLGVLQWLRALEPQYPWDADAICADAASSGNLATLQWVSAQPRGAVMYPRAAAGAVGGATTCRLGHDAAERAARAGHISVLQWVLQQPGITPQPSLCAEAAEGGHVAVLLWLRALSPPCPWSRATVKAARKRHDGELVEWAIAHGCPTRD
jgi:hypothetical protein